MRAPTTTCRRWRSATSSSTSASCRTWSRSATTCTAPRPPRCWSTASSGSASTTRPSPASRSRRWTSRLRRRRRAIIAKAEDEVEQVDLQFRRGLITDDERYLKTVDIWTNATDKVTEVTMSSFDRFHSVLMMSQSGARGSKQQIRQLAGMRGLMADPTGPDHRPADQGQLLRGPHRPRVLHLHPRRPQGPRGHGAAHR